MATDKSHSFYLQGREISPGISANHAYIVSRLEFVSNRDDMLLIHLNLFKALADTT